jgi:hypothetical protein
LWSDYLPEQTVPMLFRSFLFCYSERLFGFWFWHLEIMKKICVLCTTLNGNFALDSISYIGFRQVIRAHINCLIYFSWAKYTTQTGYMSPYYMSKAYITNLSYCNTMGPYYLWFQNELSFLARAFILPARAVYCGLVKSSK